LLASAPVFSIPERTTQNPLFAYYIVVPSDDDGDVVNCTIISGNDNLGEPAFILEPYTGMHLAEIRVSGFYLRIFGTVYVFGLCH
jgi:hypothetical protein